MHIPDGYLSPSTCAVLYAAATPFWIASVQRLKRQLTTRLVPLISVMAAFSFVIMMFNLPLPGGTTGHAVGMGLGAVILGPWGSIVAISVALTLQALFFGDGGILSLGANCFNMAIVGSLVAYGLYRLMAGRAPLTAPRRAVAAAIAGYLAINVAALCAAVAFGVQPLLFKDASGVPLYAFYPLSVAVPAMLIGHLTFAGIAEAVVTGGVVAYLQRTDPDLLRLTAPGAAEGDIAPAARGRSRLRPLLIGLLVLAILSPLGLIASGTAFGEWGSDEVVTEQARHHLESLNVADRQALAGEFDRLAARATDAQAAEELQAGGAALSAGDVATAADATRGPLEALRAADKGQYPQTAKLTAAIAQPTGLQRFGELWKAPFADYAPGFIKNERAAYIFSAVVGIALVAGIAALIGRLVARRAGESVG